jgi:hypothetical protein
MGQLKGEEKAITDHERDISKQRERNTCSTHWELLQISLYKSSGLCRRKIPHQALCSSRLDLLNSQQHCVPMSDREGRGGAANDDDLSLPRATVAKMIQGFYPTFFSLALNLEAAFFRGSFIILKALLRTTTGRCHLRKRNARSGYRVLCR